MVDVYSDMILRRIAKFRDATSLVRGLVNCRDWQEKGRGLYASGTDVERTIINGRRMRVEKPLNRPVTPTGEANNAESVLPQRQKSVGQADP